jgi:hypothetical protein
MVGLGYMDESEIEDAQAFTRQPAGPPTISPQLPQNKRSEMAEREAQQQKQQEADDRAKQEAEEAAAAKQAEQPDRLPDDTVGDVIEPHEIALQNDDWAAWCNKMIAFVRGAATADEINNWSVANAARLAALFKADPVKHARLVDMIKHQEAMRDEAGGDA